jgi:hypothetical protein
MEPRARRQAVGRVGAYLTALALIPCRCRGFAAYPGIGNGLAPAVAKGVPLRHLPDPVGDDHFAWTGTEAPDVGADLVEHPLIGRDRTS